MSRMTKIFGENAKGENGLSVFSRHFRAASANMKPSDYGLLAVLGGGFAFFGTLAIGMFAFASPMIAAAYYGLPAGIVGMPLTSLAVDFASAAKKTWKEIGWNTVPPAPPAP